MNGFRRNLIKDGTSADFTCVNCDADGLVFAKFHLEAWANDLE